MSGCSARNELRKGGLMLLRSKGVTSLSYHMKEKLSYV